MTAPTNGGLAWKHPRLRAAAGSAKKSPARSDIAGGFSNLSVSVCARTSFGPWKQSDRTSPEISRIFLLVSAHVLALVPGNRVIHKVMPRPLFSENPPYNLAAIPLKHQTACMLPLPRDP